MGQLFFRTGRRDDGMKAYEQSINILRSELAGDSEVIQRELAITLSEYTGHRAKHWERKDPERRKEIDEAITYFGAFNPLVPEDLLDLICIQWQDALCNWIDSDEKTLAKSVIKKARSAVDDLIKLDHKHIKIDHLLLRLDISINLPQNMGGFSTDEPSVPGSLDLYRKCWSLCFLDNSYIPCYRNAVYAKCLVARAFESAGQHFQSEWFYLQARSLSRHVSRLDTKDFSIVDLFYSMAKHVYVFYNTKNSALYDKRQRNAEKYQFRVNEIINRRFPKSNITPKEMYTHFKYIDLEELMNMSQVAINELDKSNSRKEAEIAVIKMAPFFIDCTFPRLPDDDKQKLRDCLDRAENKFGSLSNVLGLDDEYNEMESKRQLDER